MAPNKNAASDGYREAAKGLTTADIVAQFVEAMQAAGIAPPGEIIPDGKLHRFSTNGKRGDDSGWYVLHGDGTPAGAFGCWRSGVSETWRADLGRRLTLEEEAEVRRRIEEVKAKAEAERLERARRAAVLASTVWEEARPVTADHPYLVRKGVAPTATLRMLPVEQFERIAGYRPQARGEPLDGLLLIAPVKVPGMPSTVELIDAGGRKAMLAGGIKRAGYWATGPLPSAGRLVLCEGVATALSIHHALGEPVAAALSVGNLKAAGEAIRAERPGVQLVIAADLGEEGRPHPEAVKAAEALRCSLIAPPAALGKGGDFNDLHVRDGLEAVRRCFDAPMSRDEALRLARSALTPEVASPPYPADALGPLAEVAERIAWGAQCDIALAGQSVLAAVALLAQGVANVRTLDGSTKPLSLYCLTVAASGDGKDSADRVALRPIHDWQREAARLYERDCMAALDAKTEPPPAPYKVASDITIEGLRTAFQRGSPSQGVFSTEAGTILAGHALSPDNRIKTAAALCGLWDRGHLSVARVGTGRLERYGVRLSAHLMVQPDAASEALNDEALSGVGFWPRFLLAWPAPLPPRVHRPFRADHDPVIKAYWERCVELLRMPLEVDCDGLPVLELDEEATELLGAYFEDAERLSRLGDWQGIRPFGLRAAEHAARIAGVLAVYSGARVIDEALISHAAALVDYSIASWRSIIENGAADPTSRHAITLYRWLLEHGEPIKPGDILRLGPAPLRSKNRRDAALDRLEAAELIYRGEDKVIANPAPVHLRKPTPAKTANAAKTRVDSGFAPCESFAKVANGASAETVHSQNSQTIRKAENRMDRAFSQDSQLSQARVLDGDTWRL